MARPVQHFEIGSRDYKKAAEFYKQLFDWNMSEPPGMEYSLIEPAGEGAIGGGIGPRQEGAPGVMFYVTVDDLQATLDKAESLGGRTALPPTPIPNVGSCAMFTDLDGNVIGIFKSLEQK